MVLRYLLGAVVLFISHFAYPQITFENVTGKAGIKQVHASPIYMGGGVTFFDYNNDGLDDIFLTGGVKADKLYRNNGNFQFEDVTEETRLYRMNREHSNGAVAGDINNDGFKDLLVIYGVGESNRLYLNVNGKRFLDITATSGVANFAWSMGATFGDVNLDGWLDLYVINWVEEFKGITDEKGNTTGFGHKGYSNNLYINKGDSSFTEMTRAYNADNKGCGLAVMMTDYNSDSYPDIYMANDFGEWVAPNALLSNEYPRQSFTSRAEEVGLDGAVYGMGIAAGDYDRNGYIDYYVTNIGRNVLYKNNNNAFIDVTSEAHVENTTVNGLNTTGWGTVFADLDNDGYEDLLVSNGYIPTAEFIATSPQDPNKFYLNNKNGTFTDVSAKYGIDDSNVSRGVAVSDLDNDGDLDMLFTYIDTDISDNLSPGNVLLYQNNTSNANHFIKFKLEGAMSNRDAYNARVNVYSQEENFVRELYSSSSHNSQNSSMLHFGLGSLTKIDSVVVRWPERGRDVFRNVEVDQSYYILEGEGNAKLLGCMRSSSLNYAPDAEIDFGCLADPITAVDDHWVAPKTYIYPNPCKSILHLYSPASGVIPHRIDILSAEGKLVYSTSVDFSKTTYHATLDISHLTNGLYLLKDFNGSIFSTLRLVKK